MARPGVASRLSLSYAVAWCGAAVFGAALLWFLYCYLIDFDSRPARLRAQAAIALDVGLFTLFAGHHSLLARSGVKRWTQRLAPTLERSLYTWTASLLFIVVCTWWQAVAGALYHLSGGWRGLGYAIQIAGLALTVKSSAMLDVLDLGGVRQVQRARAGSAPRRATLETRGLYEWVRHPLYFAWLLIVFGAPDMTATRLTFALVSTAYLALAIPLEERSLIHTFGAEYEAYQRKVRWRMVPFLY